MYHAPRALYGLRTGKRRREPMPRGTRPTEEQKQAREQLAEAANDGVPPVPKEAALAFAKSRANGFGDPNAVLIDIKLLTLAQAERTIQPSGPLDGPDEGYRLVPSDAKVWLVRMNGSFRAPHPPPELRDRPARPGWMFAIIDANTGQTVSAGFDPFDPPTE